MPPSGLPRHDARRRWPPRRPGRRSTRSGRRGSPAPPAWFLHGEAERRGRGAAGGARGARAARRSRGWRCPSRSPPAPTGSTGRPAATRSTTTSPAAAPAPRRRRPSTCSCRWRRRSPRRAGSRGCPPAPAHHLELLKFGKAGETLPLDADPAAAGDDLGALPRADRALPRSGQRLHGAAAAAEADLGQRLRPPVAQGRVGRRRRSGAGAGERRRRRAGPGRDAVGVELGLGQRRLGQDAGADRPGGAAAAGRDRAAEDPLPDLHQGGGGGDAEPAVQDAGRLGDARGRRAARCVARARRGRRGGPARRSSPGRARCSPGRWRRRAA